MFPTHPGKTGAEPDHRSADAQTRDSRAAPGEGADNQEVGADASPPVSADPVRRAIEQTAGSRAFFHRLVRWFIPRPDAGNLIEKLVLLFSRVAVALSTIGLLVGGWISMERYQARMAAKAEAEAEAVAPSDAQPTDGSQAR
ncbi:MAG: hypothetical protein Q4B17_09750 [Lautropia sp.]|nr:hypothetical protein [Lautropia sp.]